jgi:hypothetical protein
MSSIKLYDSIFQTHFKELENNRIKTDHFLVPNTIDNRRGVSLIIPISLDTSAYSDLVKEYCEIEPNQYYYPNTDLHITIFTFLSARDTYKNNNEINRQFMNISENVLGSIHTCSVLLNGITFSTEAGFINGYDNNVLIGIRDSIREEMNKNGLKIDERYKSETAHITFTRFVNPLADNKRLVKKILIDKKREIGEIRINKIELVEHDWYNKLINKKVLETFKI